MSVPSLHPILSHPTMLQGDLKTAHKWLKTWVVSLQKKFEAAQANTQLQNELNVLRLEMHSHLVDILLRLNRTDLAEQELKLMNKIDEDAAQSLLWTGFVKITPDNYKEAIKLFNELRDKFGNTSLLLNAIALAHMAGSEYDKAAASLDESASIRENDPDTMINQTVVTRQLRPGADSKSTLEVLKAQFPSHPWVCSHGNNRHIFWSWWTNIGGYLLNS